MKLAIKTLFRILYRLPALWRGYRVVKVIERQQKEAERERLNRIRNPDRYRI